MISSNIWGKKGPPIFAPIKCLSCFPSREFFTKKIPLKIRAIALDASGEVTGYDCIWAWAEASRARWALSCWVRQRLACDGFFGQKSLFLVPFFTFLGFFTRIFCLISQKSAGLLQFVDDLCTRWQTSSLGFLSFFSWEGGENHLKRGLEIIALYKSFPYVHWFYKYAIPYYPSWWPFFGEGGVPRSQVQNTTYFTIDLGTKRDF